MKQTEAFVSLLEGDDYVPGSASLAITAMLADKIHASPNDSVNPLDTQTAEIITQVITNEVSNELFTWMKLLILLKSFKLRTRYTRH